MLSLMCTPAAFWRVVLFGEDCETLLSYQRKEDLRKRSGKNLSTRKTDVITFH